MAEGSGKGQLGAWQGLGGVRDRGRGGLGSDFGHFGLQGSKFEGQGQIFGPRGQNLRVRGQIFGPRGQNLRVEVEIWSEGQIFGPRGQNLRVGVGFLVSGVKI